MKRLILIGLGILMIILLFNKVEIKQPVDTTVSNLIGCIDYDYVYKLNVPATMNFYVLEKNEEDEEGFFKMINAEKTEGSTILHCGNAYYLVVTASGYEDYTEKIPIVNFKSIVPEVHTITLEKK